MLCFITSISVIAFVLIIAINIKFLTQYLPIHVDAAECDFGCLNGLEVAVYVFLHGVATIIAFLITCAIRAIQWPYILGSLAPPKALTQPRE